MLIPYENLSNVEIKHSVDAAERSLASGWERRGYPAVDLHQPLPWALSSHELRSWNFYLHCWDMLDGLLKAHSTTGESRWLVHSLRIALDWIEAHRDRDHAGLSPFAWYDMAVGLRSYRLAYLIDAGSQAGLLDDGTQEKLWRSLGEHQAYLADDSNIVFHNNHGFYQAAGQLAMGRRFQDRSPAMAEARTQGRARLHAMLQQQFAADGVHREHSPDYHRMVYDTLKAMVDEGLVDDEPTLHFAETIERSLSWFVLPNRHICNFGDSDYRLMARKPAEAMRKWRTPEMQYVVSGGAVGAAPAQDHAVFAQGGYFVVRKPSPAAPGELKRHSYLAQTAAFHSRTHKHADDASFVWYDRGTELLVDAGRYGYIGKAAQGSPLWLDGNWYEDPKRVYVETTRAHNTLEFDGLDYRRKGAKPFGSAIGRHACTADGAWAVETEFKQFGSIRHARVLVFMPGHWLLVFDWFHDNAGAPHAVKQWFHLAPDLMLVPDGDGCLVPVASSSEPLRVVPMLAGAVASRPFLAEEGERMQGWWSPKERELMPNYAFCFERHGESSASFATLLAFADTLRADTVWSKATASGRKVQLRWIDEHGRHTLLLERPVEGPLVIDYQPPKD